jgi:hypothetical protein
MDSYSSNRAVDDMARAKEREVMPYEGPGIYRHYKGGCYRVLGVGRMEKTHEKVVIYHSYNLDYELPRMAEGVDFVCRPLDAEDGEDAFNDKLASGENRFVKVS